ncbi:hypothetical protein GCM10025785_12250 [Corynebacterium canis]
MQYVTISAFTLLNKRTTRLSVVANETVANETVGTCAAGDAQASTVPAAG